VKGIGAETPPGVTSVDTGAHVRRDTRMSSPCEYSASAIAGSSTMAVSFVSRVAIDGDGVRRNSSSEKPGSNSVPSR